MNEKTCVILSNDNISQLITLDLIVLAPEYGTPELSNTEETQGSQECLQKVQSVDTTMVIVLQDDTTNNPREITLTTIAPPYSTEEGAEYTKII